jgi:heme-degrading monooxygenase HmoA
MTAVPGLHSQQSFFLAGGVEVDPTTVTTWRSFDAMRAWAYGPGAHRMYLDRHRTQGMADRSAFSRCRVVRSRGTWHGAAPEEWT